MRLLKKVAPALVALALTGCYRDTAQATLGGIAELSCKGDVTGLTALLTGDALAEFGNAAGAAAICKAATPIQGQKIKLKDVLSAQTNDGDGRAKTRTYALTVSDKAGTLVTATADCDVTWRWGRVGTDCIETGGRVSHGHCSPEFGWVDTEACKISSLKAN